jgi:hypothetical protein
MRLAVSSLSMESKNEVVELARKLSSKYPQPPTEHNMDVDVVSGVMEVESFLDQRIKGKAFGSWWEAFSKIVIKNYHRELQASAGVGKSYAVLQEAAEETWRRLRFSRIERDLIAILYCTSCYRWLRGFIFDSSRLINRQMKKLGYNHFLEEGA